MKKLHTIAWIVGIFAGIGFALSQWETVFHKADQYHLWAWITHAIEPWIPISLITALCITPFTAMYWVKRLGL